MIPRCLTPHHKVARLAASRLTPALLAALMMSTVVAAAGGEAGRLNGSWIENVRVQGIADEQVTYTTAQGRRATRPLRDLDGLRLDDQPRLAQAEQAIDNDEHAEAAEHLRAVAAGAGQAWTKHFARWRLMTTLVQLERPVEAAEAYVALVGDGAAARYLDDAPTAALRQASDADRRAARELLAEAVEAGDRAARERLEPVLAVATGEAPDPEEVADAAVVLPSTISEDPITDLLRAGDFNDALDMLDVQLDRATGQLSLRLYQQGVARLAQAEASGERTDYLDAGLSFMRVLAHFPQSGYVPFAEVELGRVHAVIGREDLARTLYDRAGRALDAERDPAYHERLTTLRSELP